MTSPHKSQTNRLLGYPDNARLLILNADDFGMYQAINEAIFRTFKEGLVRSTSLMTPWPGAAHAMKLIEQNPAINFGVHLSIICDIDNYKCPPLTPGEKVPSLVDETGTFYTMKRMKDLLAKAELDDLETEFRAQIETVLDANLKPTHLDWHCLHSGGRPDILDLTLGLAKEYGLAVRVGDGVGIKKVQGQGLPTDDYELLDSFSVDVPTKSARYAQMLRELPAGLTEWAVHPGLNSAEAKNIDDGWPVRHSDFEFLMSDEAREIIEQEGIILLSYKPIQEAWLELR
jgi:chitin disaccharide deacetylase